MRKILFICGRESSYVRNKILLAEFKETYEVEDISSNRKSFIGRHLEVYLSFIKRVLRLKSYEFVFVGFYGFFLVPFVRLFYKRRLVFDVFLSTYDTLSSEDSKFDQLGFVGPVARLLFSKNRIFSYFAKLVDRFSCYLADELWIDTEANGKYFVETLGVSKQKIRVKYLGADDIFKDRDILLKDRKRNEKYRVFYYGTGLKLQGVEVILEACKKIEKYKQIEFVIGGPIQQVYSELLEDLKLENVRFPGWIDYESLPFEIAKSDLCLGGHFSNIEKGNRVIAGKTYQFLSVGVPTIVGDNPANQELRSQENWNEVKDKVIFSKVHDPDDLAKTIIDNYEKWQQ